MSIRRENDFPATSIGRTAGAKLQISAGVDPHPLLSPRAPSPAPSEHGSITGVAAALNSGSTPRYRPYTPRQRVTPTAATTGTTVHPTSPPHSTGDATSKLQLMHLKAAAQMIGLDSGSLGWAILETLVQDTESSDGWAEIWNAIAISKATLLLPLEAAFTNEKITPDFLKDHIIICEGPAQNSAPVVTLSGLRGTLDRETLTLRSTMHPSSKLYHDILNPISRPSALSSLPPLPPLQRDNHPVAYPTFQLPAHSASLHLPRTSAPSKPPLPPRPGARGAATNATPTPRIGNPFASLFGGSKQTSQPAPSSPPASLHSIDSAQESAPTIEISAFTINNRIVTKDVGKELNKAFKTEIKSALKGAAARGEATIPYWITDRVLDFATYWYPFVKPPHSPVKRKFVGDRSPQDQDRSFIVNPLEMSVDDLADHLQDLFQVLEDDLKVSGPPFGVPKKGSESEVDDEKEPKTNAEKEEHSRKIQETLEVVERTITRLFYDRLYKQPTTDDTSHDEALQNRIAALNMLDLGLGHLGIDIGDVNESDLDAVVAACGEMLSQLDSCWCPADKATILVAAHKIVVDGLSRLPPIRLSEDSAKDQVQESSSLEKTDNSQVTVKPTANEQSENPSVLFSPDPNTVASQHLESTATTSNVTNGTTDLTTSESKHTHQPSEESKLEVSSPKQPTPVSGDVLLPLIIFSVVKSNPPHLVSHLLFTQRFRNRAFGGEESYCLINLLAVAEFLENVDMAALGLGDTDKVISTADLTPIPLARSPVTADTPLAPAHGSLRGRVNLQVDAIADSANKVISGVVDSSFGILRSFMPTNPSGPGTASGRTTPGTPGQPGFGLLRRESGFSIAGLAASLPIAGRSRSGTNPDETGQQLVNVSRPSSVRSRSRSRASLRSLKIKVGDEDASTESGSESDTTDESGSGGEESSEDQKAEGDITKKDDMKGIRSFESMLSARKDRKQRKTLTDRLASVSALATSSTKSSAPSPTPSRRPSLHVPQQLGRSTSPSSPTTSRPSSPSIPVPPPMRIGPPKQRFIECTPDDLRLSEIGELLRDYRRLVEEVRMAGGFDE